MFTKKLKVHFIGIGGIGVSALAKYYLKKGHQVTGSDLVSSEITDALKKLGAKIFIGKHKTKNLPKDANLVIYSPAVSKDNPELREAKKRGVKCQSYPQALGELTKKYFTIAVSGTHGKSTVAAMIALLLTKAGLNPTVILGTKLREFDDSNFRMGGFSKSTIYNLKSKILVIEADEHFASFLNYWPKIIILTTLEPDHLDYYKNFKNYTSAFKKFISHLPSDGILVANKNDKNIYPAFSTIVRNVGWYSLKDRESKKLKKILKIPGEFNISNALAALTVARILKIPDKISFKALSEYRGSWRRFEITKILRPKPYTLISDYGHHPTQIQVTLKAAREKYPKKKIWCIYQPHQYQRTYYLFDDFVKVFKAASVDKLIITDIYDVAGREKGEIKEKISAKKLIKAINKQRAIYPAPEKSWCGVYLPKGEIVNYLKQNLSGGEVVMIMGAGDIYQLSVDLTGMGKKKKIK